jgi:hypothetical protein
MQALSSFCNHLLSATESNRPGTGKSVGSAMSVGLVVKKFWNKMAHLYRIVQRELTQVFACENMNFIIYFNNLLLFRD